MGLWAGGVRMGFLEEVKSGSPEGTGEYSGEEAGLGFHVSHLLSLPGSSLSFFLFSPHGGL